MHDHLNENERSIYEIVFIIKKRLPLILSVFVLGVIFMGIWLYRMPYIYKGSFIIKLPDKTVTESIENNNFYDISAMKLIDNLETMRNEGRIDELSKQIKLKKESTILINSLTSSSFGKGDAILVTVEVRDPAIISELANSLVDYLFREPYFNEKININKNMLLLKINQTATKLEKLKTLKKSLTENLKDKNESYFMPSLVNIELKIMEYEDKLESIDSQLITLRGLELLGNPEIPKLPIKPKKKLNIIIAGLLFLLIGIFLSFFIEWVQENRERFQFQIKT